MALFKASTINGICVEYCNTWLPCVGDYGVYNGKIYKVVAHSGCGPSSVYTIENSNERINYKPWKNPVTLGKVIKPTGHIYI